MKKYSKQLIFDYINGNDIENFTIEELENDYIFMMEAIKYSKDKKLYNLCSLEVKNNYEFIKFMILTFKEDETFIIKLAKEYLENTTEDDITHKELTIIMSNILGKNIDSELCCFKTKAFYFYALERLEIEICLQKEKDEYKLIEYGKGYCFVLDEYGNNEIITNFFAKKFIEEIFYDSEYNFEELIHLKNKNFDSIEKMGINNYLINYIRKFDNNLANYVCCHLNILDNIKKDLLFVKHNWSYYINNLNERRLDIIENETRNYIEENNLENQINYIEIIKLALKELNLIELYEIYNDFMYLEEDFGIEQNNNVINISELKCLIFTKNLIVNLLKKDIIEKESFVPEEKNIDNQKTKILELRK